MISDLRAAHARGSFDLFAQGLRDFARGAVTLNAIAASRDVAEVLVVVRKSLTDGGGASAESPGPSRIRRARR